MEGQSSRQKNKASKSTRSIVQEDAAAFDEGTENLTEMDNMAAVIEVLRLQHGADDFQPSSSEIESLKADAYISNQTYTLNSMFNAVDIKDPDEETPIRSYSTEDCLCLISNLKNAIATSKTSDGADDYDRSTGD